MVEFLDNLTQLLAALSGCVLAGVFYLRSRILHLCMGQLRAEYREALYLAYFEGLSYAQVAEVMGKSVKQVTNMVYRGKQSLRELLKKEGITHAE